MAGKENPVESHNTSLPADSADTPCCSEPLATLLSAVGFESAIVDHASLVDHAATTCGLRSWTETLTYVRYTTLIRSMQTHWSFQPSLRNCKRGCAERESRRGAR